MHSLTTVQTGLCAAKLAVPADPTRLAAIEYLLERLPHRKGIKEELRWPQNLLSHP
jgi:hypothetical protein